MGRFDISPAVAEEYRRRFRQAVGPQLDEDVIAVGTFRTTGTGTKYAISKAQAGAVAYGVASLIGRKAPKLAPSSRYTRIRRQIPTGQRAIPSEPAATRAPSTLGSCTPVRSAA